MQHRDRQRGFTLIEILIVIVIAIILAITTVALPYYHKQVMLSHETAAIGSIRTIQLAETQYATEYGRFAASLAQLGPPASGAPGENAAELTPQDLADGKNNGYSYTITARPTGFAIHAAPDVFNSTGRFTFYSDETLVIRRNGTGELATAASPQVK
jgi:prepilin-type N-terminal cleavage/methylation domain-containing protein